MTRPGVYAALGPEGIALMDTRRGRGRWRFLDPVGSQLWLTITSGTEPERAVELITARWQEKGADPVQVRAGLSALAADLQYARLLAPAGRPLTARDGAEVRFDAPVPAGIISRFAGHAALFGALTLLRCLPVRFALAAARAVTRLPGDAATVTQAEAAFTAVRRAARVWPGRAACLEESLAAHFAAAFTGHRVRWVIGARFTPHGAHAWIEAGGSVIGQDESDRIWPYVPALQVERSH